MKLIDSISKFTLDFSRMNISELDLESLQDKFTYAMYEMSKLESGAIKNPDENRQVTHFTDRINYLYSELFNEVELFAHNIQTGVIKSGTQKQFNSVVINGIGGSILGPQLMQFAFNGQYWNEKSDKARNNYLKVYFLDNGDSAGFNDILEVIDLETTLHLCISKSGGTQEILNNLIALENVYTKNNLNFANYACAITMQDSKLDKHAKTNNWLKVFPMKESIGGRTSETSIVGHLPAALAGINFAEFIQGALHMDSWTREYDYKKNPALMLAAIWYLIGNGKGDRNMIIIPYSDRLVLLSRYFQQLIMESLGKKLDRDGNIVNQGLNVFGNKGGTDAHAFIQQLNDGRNDFFITFIEILQDKKHIQITDNLSMGDYLHGFLYGLITALEKKNRPIISIELPELTPAYLGMIIALYERAVAIYAEFININAYNQPGVQAYKLAAKDIIETRNNFFNQLQLPCSGTLEELIELSSLSDKREIIAGWLNRASKNSYYNVNYFFSPDKNDWIYEIKKPE